MLTKKKQAAAGLWIGVGVLFLLVGCSPSGPDDMLAGKRLLDRGQPASAVRKLREATSRMPTNALAWGYLGLAYQQGGSVSNAVRAYSRALALKPDFAEVRFNLGCLWMEAGQWALAREHLAAASLLQKRSAVTWQQLGEAQVRLGEYDSAARSLGEALRLDQKSADTWNWLGVAQFQQGRIQESLRSFQAALHLQANHGPALLNLAIVTDQKLKNPDKALELYRQYLAFLPHAANAGEVKRLADQREAGLRADSESGLVVEEPARRSVEKLPTGPDALTTRGIARTSRVTRVDRSHPTGSSQRPKTVQTEPVAEPATETVRVTPLPAIASPANRPEAVQTRRPTGEELALQGPSPSTEPPTPPQVPTGEPSRKRGFFAKINPLNLFRRKSGERRPTPLSSRADPVEEGHATNTASAGD